MRRQVLVAGMFFVFIDACMTFGFGMFTGADTVFKPVMAFALGGASAALGGLLVPLTAHLHNQGWRIFPYFICGVLFLGFWLNLASNAGFSAAMLQTEIIQAKNANTLAKDAREKVARLRKRDDELTRQIDFKPTFGGDEWLAPAAYDAIIMRAKNETERGRNIYQRSKECTDTTVASSQRVCQTIASALATKQNAIARRAAIDERRQVRAELKEAESYSKENQLAVSAGASQAEFVARFVTANLRPGQAVMDWTTMGTALAISFLISLLGWTLNAAAILLPAPTPAAATEPRRAPIALPAEPAPLDPHEAAQRAAERHSRMEVYRETTTIEKQRDDRNKQLWDSLEAFEESISKARQQLA